METLPVEILRYYVKDIYDCVALRRTCKWYRNFTISVPLVWLDRNNVIMNENNTDSVASMRLRCGQRIMPVELFTNSRDYMHRYLDVSELVGSEYTLWLCCIRYERIQPEIKNISDLGYTHIIRFGLRRTAVYIRTEELQRNMYMPTENYFDVMW